MIYFYSGTPGSGKSLEVAKEIVKKLTVSKQNVIATIDINTNEVYKKKKKHGRFYYIRNEHMTPEFLIEYAMKFHKKGQEGQTLLIFDEAQMLFSPTVIKLKTQEDKRYRVAWLDFFTQHRHLGYNIIIISQFDRLIDPQIRCLFEYNVIHRKINNFGMGWVMSLLKISLFISVTVWYGVNEKMGSHFYFYSKRYSRIYDSYKKFDDMLKLRKLKLQI